MIYMLISRTISNHVYTRELDRFLSGPGPLLDQRSLALTRDVLDSNRRSLIRTMSGAVQCLFLDSADG